MRQFVIENSKNERKKGRKKEGGEAFDILIGKNGPEKLHWQVSPWLPTEQWLSIPILVSILYHTMAMEGEPWRDCRVFY